MFRPRGGKGQNVRAAGRLVRELHGMLKAMSPDDPTGRAMKIRHYAKWLRSLSDPGADMMFRMASAISRFPDQEFKIKAPPLDVSYGK